MQASPVAAANGPTGDAVYQFGTGWGREADPACRAFSAWAKAYAAVAPGERAGLEYRGVELAAARRAVVRQLIENDPAGAIASTVPFSVRQELPEAIVKQLEQRVSGMGSVTLRIACGENVATHYSRSVELGGSRYQAHVYGERDSQGTRDQDSLHGIVLDRHLAVLASPLRLLEIGEQPTVGKRIVVDLRGSQSMTDPVVMESGEGVYYASSAAALSNEMIPWKLAFGGPPVGTSGGPNFRAYRNSTTSNRILAMPVVFKVDPTITGGQTPVLTQAAAQAGLIATDIWLRQASYGRCGFGGPTSNAADMVATSVLTLPKTQAEYNDLNDRGNQLLADARAKAKEIQSVTWDTANFEFDVVFYENKFIRGGVTQKVFPFSGLANQGAKGMWCNVSAGQPFDIRLFHHEIGHALGLNHAGIWERSAGSLDPLDPAGYFEAYGSPFDPLGVGGETAHYSANYKYLLGWIPETNIQTVDSTTTVKIYAHDAGGVLNSSRKYGIRIPVQKSDAGGPNRRDYWLDTRTVFNEAVDGYGNKVIPLTQRDGVAVQWGDDIGSPQGSCFLDSTPGSSANSDARDGLLLKGKKFLDPTGATGIGRVEIETIDVGGSGADRWADVKITTPNADLASLNPSKGALSPAFSVGTSDYSMTLLGATSLSLQPTASSPSATLKWSVNGGTSASFTSGTALNVPLLGGRNFVEIQVTNAGWQKKYLVTVYTLEKVAGTGIGAIPESTGPEGYTNYEGPPREILFDLTGQSGTVSDLVVDFTLNPAHPFCTDIIARLVAPDNTVLTVLSMKKLKYTVKINGQDMTFTGDDSDLAGPYFFGDVGVGTLSAAASATTGGTVPSGRYTPELDGATTSLITTFKNKPLAGIWKLRFTDHWNNTKSGGVVSAANLHFATQPPPPTPDPTVTAPTHTAITQTSATLGGNVTNTNGGTLSERGVVLVAGSSAPALNSTTTSVTKLLASSATTGAFTVNATALSPNTTYTYRAFASNTAGGTGYSPSGTFTTLPLNIAPKISDILDRVINEDSNTGAIAFTITDPDAGAVFTVSATSSDTALVPNANIVLTGSGSATSRTVSVTPVPNAFGSTAITLTVSDGAATATDVFNVTVNPVNDMPSFGFSAPGSVSRAVNSGVQTLANVVSSRSPGVPPNESTQTVTMIVTNNNNALFSVQPAVSGNSVIFTPGNTAGSATVTLLAQDNGGTANSGVDLSASQTFVITITPAPGTVSNATHSNVATTSVTFSAEVTGNGGGTILSRGFVYALATVAVPTEANSTSVTAPLGSAGGLGPMSFTPTNLTANTDYNYRAWVRNAAGITYSSATSTFKTTQGAVAPTITDVANVTMLENGTDNTRSFSVADANAGSTLTVTVSSNNPALLPPASVVLTKSGDNYTMSLQPLVSKFGDATITLTVSDGALTATDVFVVTVQPINDRPTFTYTAPGTINVAAGAGPQTRNGIATSLSAGPNESAQTVSFIVTNDNTNLFSIAPSIDAAGTLTFTPGNAAGTATVSFFARDSGGTANGGNDTSTPTRSFSIVVSGGVPTVNNPAASDVTVTSARLSGFVSSDGGLAVTERGVVVMAGSGTPVIDGLGVVKWPATGTTGAFTVTASSLGNGTAYNFRPYAINSAGTSYSSVTGTFTTLGTPGSVPSGAVSWWKGETNANDSIGSNNGTLNLGSYTAGKVNQAFSLTGASGRYVRVGNDSSLKVSTGTVDAWVRTSSSAFQAIIVKQYAYGLYLDGNKLLSHIFTYGNVTTRSLDLNDNLWHHVAMSFDSNPASRGVKLYVDGVLQGSDPYFAVSDQNYDLVIGAGLPDGSFQNFAGNIDEARLYNRVLTAPEIDAIYRNSVGARPVVSDIANPTIYEDAVLAPVAFTITDADVGAAFNVSATSSNQTLVPNANLTLGGSGSSRTISAVPLANQFGSTDITITVDDCTQRTTETFTLTVAPVNDAPSLVIPAGAGGGNFAINVTAGSGLQTRSAFATSLSAGPANESAQAVRTTVISNSNPALFLNQPTFDATGTLTFTPGYAAGTANITLRASDDGGTANGGIDVGPTNTFTITVLSAVPVVTILSEFGRTNVTADLGVKVDSSYGAPLLANGLIVAPTSLGSPLLLDSPGVLIFPCASLKLGVINQVTATGLTPNTSYSYRGYATNSIGTGYFGAIAQFTTTNVNAPPSITPPNDDPWLGLIFEDSTGGPYTITLNDADPGAVLTLTAVSLDPALLPTGNIVLGGSGKNRTLSLTPSPDQSGSAQIELTVSDGIASQSLRVVATVRSVNDAPSFDLSPTLPLGISGGAWTARETMQPWSAIASSADGMKLAASAYQIYRTTNRGETWAADGIDLFADIASSADGQTLLRTPKIGYFAISRDGGLTWSYDPDYSNDYVAVAMSANASIMAVIKADNNIPWRSGLIHISTDSGVTWTAASPSQDWTDVAISPDGSLIIGVVHGGQIFTSADNGTTWTARESLRNWKAIASSQNGTHLLAAEEGGQLYVSHNAGVAWTPTENARQWSSVAISNNGTRMVASARGDKIYTSDDSGATWTARDSNRQWAGVASSADGLKLAAVDTDGFIYTSNSSINIDAGAGPFSLPGALVNISVGPNEPLAQGVWFITYNDNNALFTVQPQFSPAGDLTFTAGGRSGVAHLTIWAEDGGGTSYGGENTSTQRQLTITIENRAPTAIALSEVSVLENSPPNATIGTLAATDTNNGQIHSFALVSGAGDTDNALFAISGSRTLKLTVSPDFETQPSYSIRVRADDGNGGLYEQALAINVIDINEAPTYNIGTTIIRVPIDAGPRTFTNFVTNLSGGPGAEAAQTVTPILNGVDNAGLFSAQPNIDASGTLRFTPTGTGVGETNATVRVQDNGGTANGGVQLSEQRLIKIIIDPTLPKITGPTISNVADTTATVSANVTFDGGAAVQQRGIVLVPASISWEPRIGGTGVVQLPISGTTGVFNANFANLKRRTDYVVRGYAYNGVNSEFSYTDSSLFRTKTIYELWANGYSIGTAPTGANGAPNILNFAFDMNPVISSQPALQLNGTFAAATYGSGGMPFVRYEPTQFSLDFRGIFSRRTDRVAAELTYTAQFSSDMSFWVDSPVTPTVLAVDGTGQYEIVSVPFPPFLNGKKVHFFRVAVSTP